MNTTVKVMLLVLFTLARNTGRPLARRAAQARRR